PSSPGGGGSLDHGVRAARQPLAEPQRQEEPRGGGDEQDDRRDRPEQGLRENQLVASSQRGVNGSQGDQGGPDEQGGRPPFEEVDAPVEQADAALERRRREGRGSGERGLWREFGRGLLLILPDVVDGLDL